MTDMMYELKKLASHIDFLYNQQNYRTVAGSINTMGFQWLCLHGEMKIMDGCGKMMVVCENYMTIPFHI